jgi:hypothetical protein
MSIPHTTPPQPSLSVTPPLSTIIRPTTPLSLLTTSWKMLNQEQLAHKTWTCKDPLCRRSHHQIPMDYHSTLSMWKSLVIKPCPRQSSEHGSATIPTPQPCTAVSPHQQDIPALSPLPHLTVPRFVVGSRPKDDTLRSPTRSSQRRPQMWHQQMARQQLAIEAAHALLSGVSYHSHPLSLKCRSPAKNPPNPCIPDRAVEATHIGHPQ